MEVMVRVELGYKKRIIFGAGRCGGGSIERDSSRAWLSVSIWLSCN